MQKNKSGFTFSFTLECPKEKRKWDNPVVLCEYLLLMEVLQGACLALYLSRHFHKIREPAEVVVTKLTAHFRILKQHLHEAKTVINTADVT